MPLVEDMLDGGIIGRQSGSIIYRYPQQFQALQAVNIFGFREISTPTQSCSPGLWFQFN
jgi:3-hydroxyacyl-CoA dehydrogenase